ncbi:MarR family winged helix-turn-helix transcriptional regulator [Streptomyces sp. NPDC051362]|uniref:MarR family winged helix-turn-helix transcriptional regulator n=1 Tax=Streptomyces sp. NPDC051362 TaxID=3365651 RepID=UPI0037BBF5CC
MSSTKRQSQPLQPDEEALLRALARVTLTLPRMVDADLIRDRQVSLSEYRVLMRLAEAPERQLRFGALVSACDLSPGGLSRLVTRLEKRELAQRVQLNEDARGWNVRLTDHGLTHLKQVWPTHLDSMRRHVLDRLADHEVAPLAAALRKIAH